MASDDNMIYESENVLKEMILYNRDTTPAFVLEDSLMRVIGVRSEFERRNS
jgi:hypothetical protein